MGLAATGPRSAPFTCMDIKVQYGIQVVGWCAEPGRHNARAGDSRRSLLESLLQTGAPRRSRSATSNWITGVGGVRPHLHARSAFASGRSAELRASVVAERAGIARPTLCADIGTDGLAVACVTQSSTLCQTGREVWPQETMLTTHCWARRRAVTSIMYCTDA